MFSAVSIWNFFDGPLLGQKLQSKYPKKTELEESRVEQCPAKQEISFKNMESIISWMKAQHMTVSFAWIYIKIWILRNLGSNTEFLLRSLAKLFIHLNLFYISGYNHLFDLFSGIFLSLSIFKRLVQQSFSRCQNFMIVMRQNAK